jgi:hypothetical protein
MEKKGFVQNRMGTCCEGRQGQTSGVIVLKKKKKKKMMKEKQKDF